MIKSKASPFIEYPGLEHLKTLDQCRKVPQGQVSPALQGISTPLDWEVWQEALALHPDRELVEYITTGLREGFRIGYNYQAHKS